LQITGGKFKGLKLFTPPQKSLEIRPLRSRVRKALFDTLGNHLEGLKVLDLFAGTGALGLEALSRGAKVVVFVDGSPLSLEIIRKNLQKINPQEEVRLFQMKLPEGLPSLSRALNLKFDLIFITPPYGKGLSLKTLTSLPESLLAEEARVIVEEKSSLPLPEKVKNLFLIKRKVYGETALHFYLYQGESSKDNREAH